jgi:hypothetical protein
MQIVLTTPIPAAAAGSMISCSASLSLQVHTRVTQPGMQKEKLGALQLRLLLSKIHCKVAPYLLRGPLLLHQQERLPQQHQTIIWKMYKESPWEQ